MYDPTSDHHTRCATHIDHALRCTCERETTWDAADLDPDWLETYTEVEVHDYREGGDGRHFIDLPTAGTLIAAELWATQAYPDCAFEGPTSYRSLPLITLN